MDILSKTLLRRGKYLKKCHWLLFRKKQWNRKAIFELSICLTIPLSSNDARGVSLVYD